jgi:hypothetical protein
LLDEGTPILSATPFLDRGHRVIYHGDVLSGGASDEVVVATAILSKAALIAVDLDFKRVVKRFGSPNSSEKYSKFDLIFIGCDPVMASKRIEHAMSFIENEWAVSRERRQGDFGWTLTIIALRPIADLKMIWAIRLEQTIFRFASGHSAI